jgi:hypothetical protein
MKRILAFAIPALLVLPSLAPAQTYTYSRGSAASNPATLVRSDYEGYLRREPAPAASSWIQSRRNGATPQSVLSDVLASDEYYAAAGGTRPAYVRQLYFDLIGREPLPAEINYWAGRLDHEPRWNITHQMVRHHPQNNSVLVTPPAPYDPGYLPDPASPTFRDPSGPYFHSPYFYNYERAPAIRNFELRSQG